MDVLTALDRIGTLARDAILHEERWTQVLEVLSSALDAHGGVLFVPGIGENAPRTIATSGCAVEGFPKYLADWVAHDAWWARAAEMNLPFVPGLQKFGHELLSTREFHRTPFFTDFTRTYDYDDVAALFVSGGDGTPPVQLCLYRPMGAEPFGDEARRVLTQVWPALKEAADAAWQLRRARLLDSAVADTLDTLPHPTWIVRRDLCVCHANRAARELQSRGLWVKAGVRRLMAVGDLDETALQWMLRPGAPGELPCTRIAGERIERALLRVVPIGEASAIAASFPAAGFLVSLNLPLPIDTPATLTDAAVRRFGLSAAEQRVLDRLLAGKPPKQIADEMHVSINTVRTHLRGLFDKTGCRRQADLVRVVLGSG